MFPWVLIIEVEVMEQFCLLPEKTPLELSVRIMYFIHPFTCTSHLSPEMFSGYNWQTRILEVRLDRLPPSELDISTHSSHLNSSAGSSSFSSYGVPSSSDRIPFTSNLDDFPFSDSRSRTLSNGMTRNLFVGNVSLSLLQNILVIEFFRIFP